MDGFGIDVLVYILITVININNFTFVVWRLLPLKVTALINMS